MKSEDQPRMHEDTIKQSFYKPFQALEGVWAPFSRVTGQSWVVQWKEVLEKTFTETERETESWIMEGEGKPPPYNYGAISTDANYQQPPPPYPAGGKYVSSNSTFSDCEYERYGHVFY